MKENLTINDLPPINKEEKDWWDKHNSEYYHYFYRIDNILNRKFYYGIHSTLKSNVKSSDLSKDGYWGSGVGIKRAINKYGIDKFTKTIIKTFSTRDEARLEEMIVVDEDMVNDPMCYNSVLGGGSLFITEGLVVVRFADPSINNGKFFLILSEEYHKNKDKYITPTSGKLLVNYKSLEKRKENFFLISLDEYYKNKDIYITMFNTDVGCYKNKDNWSDIRFLDTQDPLVLSGQFVGIAKGIKQSKETIKKRSKEGNGMYNKIWITDGIMNKVLDKEQEIPEGWKKGKAQKSKEVGEGHIRYTNKETLESKYLNKEDSNELDKDIWFTDAFFLDNKFISYEILQNLYNETPSLTRIAKRTGKCIESIRKVKNYYESKGFSFHSDNKLGRITKGKKKYKKL